MTTYSETVAALRTLAARAGAVENVVFCERRPLTSLEARFAGLDRLAADLQKIEDEALAVLKRLVDAEQGYESALLSVEQAGTDAGEWLRAVTMARALQTLSTVA